MSVKSQHEDYKKYSPMWQRCEDVAAGQDAVHGAADAYLPKLRDQLPEDYEGYKKRASFYNATWRTISGLVGMVFRRPAKLVFPEAIKELLDDVTMAGMPLDQFAKKIVTEVLKTGRVGVLVDYPPSVPGTTMADAAARNLRPSMQLYRAQHIINWRTARVNNATVLTLVVLQECALVPKDEFESARADRYRVLDLGGPGNTYRQRVFSVGPDGKDILEQEIFPVMGGKPIPYITFAFIGPDDNGAEAEDPPLIDLVNTNLSHYRTTADLEHGAHFTGLPTAWIAGHTPDDPNTKMYIGSGAAWTFKSPDTKVGFLEFTGEGLGALEKLLTMKETHMAVLGARMLEPQKRGVESADYQSIHRKGEESMLAGTAKSISLSMEQVLEWFALWAGAAEAEAESTEYSLSTDFYPVPMTDKMLLALVGAWQQGAISDQTLFDNLQAGEVIDEGTTLEDEQARIQEAGPRLMPGAAAQAPAGAPPKPRARTVTEVGSGRTYKIEG